MHARWDAASLFKSPAGEHAVDPYARWVVATQARGIARWVGTNRQRARLRHLHILAHTEDPAQLDALIKGAEPAVKVGSVYGEYIPGTQSRSHHFTAIVAATAAGYEWLLSNPLNLRWKLAMPLRDAQRAAAPSAKGRFGPYRDELPMRARNLVRGRFESASSRDRPKALPGAIAVIDYGCPFLHDSFAEGRTTRVAALWDQGQDPCRNPAKASEPGSPWQRPAKFPNGRELGPKALTRLRQACLDGASSLDEREIYRGLDHLIEFGDPRRRVWHATHGGMVLDIAGGRFDRLAPSATAVDEAGQARLVFVELPTLTSADSSGGSLGAHLLDGIRYAMSVTDPEQPLVVVICHGNAAGPHDGSSLIERAMDELVQARDGRMAIVLAAGNSREQGGHVRRTVHPDRSVMFRLDFSGHDSTDSFVEIWYPRDEARVEMRVRTPDQMWSPWIAPGREIWLRSVEQRGDVVAMLRHDAEVPNGKGSMALLAIAPTAAASEVDGSLAAAGRWDIECRLVPGSGEPVPLEAWIERDDPLRGSGHRRTAFIDCDEDDECNTLSALATGACTFKAGGFNLETGRAARYSSLPAFDADGRPVTAHLLLAACEEDMLQPTIAAAATRSVDVYRMNGTSVAAPVLARRVFNAMRQHGPFTLDELASLLVLWAESGADSALAPLKR